MNELEKIRKKHKPLQGTATLVTQSQLTKMLGWSRSTVFRYIVDGKITPVFIGKNKELYIDYTQLSDELKAQAKEPLPKGPRLGSGGAKNK